MNPHDNLLEKAKKAHFDWTWNNPMSEQVKAMAELGDAIQEVEALAPRRETFTAGGHIVSYKPKQRNRHGDLQRFTVTRGFIGEQLYILLEIHTLTAQPYRYGYEAILRRINGLFLIETVVAMPIEVWAMTSCAINELYNADKEGFYKVPKDTNP